MRPQQATEHLVQTTLGGRLIFGIAMAAAASGAHSSTASVEDVIDYFDKIRDGLTNARDGTAALPELLLCVRDDSRVEDVRAAVEDDGAPVNGEVGDVRAKRLCRHSCTE